MRILFRIIRSTSNNRTSDRPHWLRYRKTGIVCCIFILNLQKKGLRNNFPHTIIYGMYIEYLPQFQFILKFTILYKIVCVNI